MDCFLVRGNISTNAGKQAEDSNEAERAIAEKSLRDLIAGFHENLILWLWMYEQGKHSEREL